MANRVFLTYRHESPDHCRQVRDLALRLEQVGLDVVLDQFAQEREFHGGGPDEGWPQWCLRQARDPTHSVLIIASRGWFSCFDGSHASGSALGVVAEAGVIRQRLYTQAGKNCEFRIVTFGPLMLSDIPVYLQPYHVFNDPTDFAQLTSWLQRSLADSERKAKGSDWPASPPTLLWPVANQSIVRTAFVQLLGRTPAHRYLPLYGPSETGKSYLTRHVLGNALRLKWLACGRFDFKGGVDRDAELHNFIQPLGISMPQAGASLHQRLSLVLESLLRMPRPTLLIFDTYERCGDAGDWVEMQLLPALIRCEWLRVIIAGQVVPQATGSLWEFEAAPTLTLVPPTAEEWFAFCQSHRPSVTLDFVRQAHALCGGKVSVLAQLLGPA